MAENQFDKTEAPTPRRREEARQSGNIPRSTDLTAACMLLGAIVLLHKFGLHTMTELKVAMQAMLGSAETFEVGRVGDLAGWSWYMGRVVAIAAGPLVLGLTAVALLANVGQVGFILTSRPLQPNFSRLFPLKGLGTLFNRRSGVKTVMNLAKVGVLGTVAVMSVWGELPKIVGLCRLDPLPMFGAACELVYVLALKLAAVLLVLALLDYVYQRWQHLQDLKMSKQEVKEELRRMEGDPTIRQRRLRVARQLVLQRIGQSVPKADVVVTNPTHYSVALKYDSKNDKAPKVVAKGADFLALRIRQIAIANGVPIVERKELARALYSSVEVGQEIPPQFYTAVAEILAYVYRLSGRRRPAAATA